jgi:hypothetical protein
MADIAACDPSNLLELDQRSMRHILPGLDEIRDFSHGKANVTVVAAIVLSLESEDQRLMPRVKSLKCGVIEHPMLDLDVPIGFVIASGVIGPLWLAWPSSIALGSADIVPGIFDLCFHPLFDGLADGRRFVIGALVAFAKGFHG